MKKENYLIWGLGIVIILIGIYLIARKLGKLPDSLDVFKPEGNRQLKLVSPFMTGADVRELQNQLNGMYAVQTIDDSPGKADGSYGPLTKIAHDQALRAFNITDRSLSALEKSLA